jgi:tRNA A-37 threonylcarbamoyl transferase component Bud32
VYRLGRYQLVARLGTGGMAEVWKARTLDAPDAPYVVVKRVLPEHAHDPAFVKSLRVEAEMLERLRVPGVVRLFGLEEIDGQLLLTLEYVDGCDLRRLGASLARSNEGGTPPPPGLGAHVVHDVCRVLGRAHRFDDGGTIRAILHRDVSPSNVMVTRDGEVKLVDFGIAKALFESSEETRSRSIRGKLAYMAPEQLRGQAAGCTADVYGAGVILYELLTGRRLFTAQTLSQMAMAREGQMVPPSSVNPAVPAALDEVCLRALRRAPETRYRDGAEMAEALAPILPGLAFDRAELGARVARLMPRDGGGDDKLGTATVPSAARQVALWRRAWLPVAAVLVVGLCTAALLLWSHRQARRADAPTVGAPTASAPTASAPTASAPTASAPTATPPTATPPTATPPTAKPAVVATPLEPAAPPVRKKPSHRATQPPPPPKRALENGQLAPF